MKRFLFAAALSLAITPAFATDVGVSITVGEPGFYGHIDIGNYPRPALIYPEPIVIQPVPMGVIYQPVYMRVPPGHAKKWSKHCHRYNACNRPVYFVQDSWYNSVYVPYYRERHGHHDGHGKGKGYDDDHGKGKGKGKGKGRDD